MTPWATDGMVGEFHPVTDSSDATRLQASLELDSVHRQPLLDYWDRLFQDASRAIADENTEAIEALNEQVLKVMISRDEKILELARQYHPEHLPAAEPARADATSAERAVQVYHTGDRPLQLSADVIRQQLVCYFSAPLRQNDTACSV